MACRRSFLLLLLHHRDVSLFQVVVTLFSVELIANFCLRPVSDGKKITLISTLNTNKTIYYLISWIFLKMRVLEISSLVTAATAAALSSSSTFNAAANTNLAVYWVRRDRYAEFYSPLIVGE